MTGIKRRIEKLEKKTESSREESLKQIKVRFVAMDGMITDTMIIDLDQRKAEG